MSHKSQPPTTSVSSYEMWERPLQSPEHSTVHLDPSGNDSNVFRSERPKRKFDGSTTASIASLFLFAIACTLAHLFFFRYLDGRRIDIDTSVPQSWIAPISFLLASVFRAALCACLGIAFYQHCWRVLSDSTLTVRAIDRLYVIQQNLLALPHFENARASPTLFLLTCLTWLVPLAILFPSGAIVVTGKLFETSSDIRLPIFNPADIGNGSLSDALRHSLTPSEDLFEFSALEGPVTLPNLVKVSAAITLVSEQVFTTPSPCGSNCSYATKFEGPFVQCNSTATNKTAAKRISRDSFNLLEGGWDHGGWKPSEHQETSQGGTSVHKVPDTFTIRTVPPLAWQSQEIDGPDVWSMWTETQLNCKPCRARYTVSTNYTASAPSYQVSTEFIDCLEDFWYEGTLPITNEPDMSLNSSEQTIGNLRATNLFILTNSLISMMSGQVPCGVPSQNNPDSSNLGTIMTPDNKTHDASEAFRIDCVSDTDDANMSTMSITFFNKARSSTEITAPDFSISQDLLNEVLVNITLSAMNRLALWSTEAPATTRIHYNTYSFNHPLRLILPYFISLVLSIPFIIVGILALIHNGAPAPSGGVIDVLAMGSKSETLMSAAEKVSFEKRSGEKELGRLRVGYSKINGGLGVEEELRGRRIA
ncbi:hypothetical protein BCR34DRAFT_227937 [Clohesyomyces aquaticus]|uniref:Uncharacterized protein n=1 Tax=Clohesyomyces aquaticus TaxID=1231657 RepID=A0A1Y1ZWE6_9PLEO|nr:hypothetical protein BCR34DRAFT_227937 [Clohesyomyces aquaticus]